MVLLDIPIFTEDGIIERGAVKIIRKAGRRYVIKRGTQVAYADEWQLRFLKTAK